MASRGVSYQRQPLPPKYDADWFARELQNIQRAIAPSILRETAMDDSQQKTDCVVWQDSTAASRTFAPFEPSAAGFFPLTIKNVGTGGHTVTILATIDGVLNPTLADGVWMEILSNGAVWRQIG